MPSAIVRFPILIAALWLQSCTPDSLSRPSALNPVPTLSPAGQVTAPSPARRAIRAAWVWDEEALTHQASRSEVLAFARQEGLTHLYVNAYPALSPIRAGNGYEPGAFAEGLEEARQASLSIEILIGDLEWGNDPAATEWSVVNLIRPIAAFTRQVEAKPTALHFDIEPQAHPAWPALSVEERRAKIVGLCAYLEAVRTELASQSAPLAITADLPAWWDEEPYVFTYGGVTRSGFEHVLSRVDSAVVAAYAASGTGVVASARFEVGAAGAMGKPVVIGVETDPAYAAIAFPTRAALTLGLSQVDAAFQGAPGFAGTAIHHMRTWRRLPVE